AEAFSRHAGVDPHRDGVSALRRAAGELGTGCGLAPEDRDGWLSLLLSHRVQPALGRGRPAFLYDFPASQAALARIRPGAPPLAERFEVFVEGVELANGYHELTDSREQAERFRADLALRTAMGLPAVSADERLIAALEAGLPPCAGVALGFDRLVMLALGAGHIDEVLAFPVERA
ncbi:MAG: EF-P lysine aminoacylase GenX, partial [Gammaproteobacteria bacterium]|nr:EF-P lysine aminoacylase GenX [Gammaproteobacteria bacterium]